jgi:hypothetical protein
LALDEALGRLATLDPRAAHVVELRFFGGLTERETSEELVVSIATMKRDWIFARAWLINESPSSRALPENVVVGGRRALLEGRDI